MNSPFSFGRAVRDESFTNREGEIRRLTSNFTNGVNTTIISPRRWGKSSLVAKVAAQVETRRLRIASIDLFGIRTEGELYNALANAVIRATSSRTSEWLALAGKFIRGITPRFTMELGDKQSLDLTLDLDIVKKYYRELLELPEKIAAEKKIRMVICIDEFQNIGTFADSLQVQKRLRSIWQHQQLVTYCLYGSRQHMMTDLFSRQSNPFYRFGEIMHLPKITEAKWVSYITRQFRKTGKEISAELAGKIATAVDCHPYYVQQLSHLVWLNTVKTAGGDALNEGVKEMMNQNALLYYRESESLNNTELRLLRAIAAGERQLTSRDTVTRYNLGTSAGVVKAKKSLVKKEIIDDDPHTIQFLDPVFRMWFLGNLT